MCLLSQFISRWQNKSSFFRGKSEWEVDAVVHHWPPFRNETLITPAVGKCGGCRLIAEPSLGKSSAEKAVLFKVLYHPFPWWQPDPKTSHWNEGREKFCPTLFKLLWIWKAIPASTHVTPKHKDKLNSLSHCDSDKWLIGNFLEH